jgi:hypothetical protein
MPPDPASCADSEVDLDTERDLSLAADEDGLEATRTGAVEGDVAEELEADDGGMGADLEDDLLREEMISIASKMPPDEEWVPYRQRWLKNHRKNEKCKLT